MSQRKKISIVLLGKTDAPKKTLANTILGNDSRTQNKQSILTKTEKYENDMYEIINTPDLNDPSGHKDIKDLFQVNPQFDMSLVVMETRDSTDDVEKQINQLHKLTGKDERDFMVLLPLSHDDTSTYPFKHCTLSKLFEKLGQMSRDCSELHTAKRDAEYPRDGKMEKPHPKMGLVGTGKRPSGNPKIALLGMTGTGKSASGNTILGRQKFLSRASTIPITKECQDEDTVIDGSNVKIIDTPDFFDEHIQKDMKYHVRKCQKLCQTGPCVYLLVMQVGRFTEGERDILKKLEAAFKGTIRDRTIVLFTRGDDLVRANMSLQDFVNGTDPHLKQIVEQCGNRAHVFENKSRDSQQVSDLMDMVLKLM